MSTSGRSTPAGDFNYEAPGIDYARYRQPEPAFLDAIVEALGDARSLINVGAGAGSYEPSHLAVTPVEPSAAMRAQRPAHLAPAVDAVAEDLPFPDQSFDAALASFTVHQWKDLGRGLAEVRRVTRGPIVILTFDPKLLTEFWLREYLPELLAAEAARMPSMGTLAEALGGRCEAVPLPVPANCSDGILEAYFGRPESFLDEGVRRAQSSWAFVDPEVQAQSIASLSTAIETGEWDGRYGDLREAPSYLGSLRLIVDQPNW